MNKTYEYRTKQYNYKIKYIGIFAIFFLIYSIYNFATTQKAIYLAPIIICIYIIWEDFISNSNPKIVTITDDSISFSSFNKTHTYKWSQIKRFQIKEFITARKMFIRINGGGILSGRYWVNCYYMNDCDELYLFLRDKEYEIDPYSLKSQARRSNEADFEERKKKAEEKAKLKEQKEKEKRERRAAKKLAVIEKKEGK